MQHLDDGVLQAWLDGPRSGLSASERVEIGRHLSDCDACGRKLKELEALSRRVETMLSGPESESEPVPAFEAVLARADRHHAMGRRRSRWTTATWAASIAAALGLGWLGNGLYRGPDTAPTASEQARIESPSVRGGVSGRKAAADAAAPSPASVASAASDTPGAALRSPRMAASPAAQIVAAAKPAPDTLARPADRGALQSQSPARTVDAAKPLAEATALAAGRPAAGAPERARRRPATGAPERVAGAATELESDSGRTVVHGRVTDESGRPLEAAQVFVTGSGVGTVTRRDGTFALSLGGLPSDSSGREITLKAQLIGFHEETRSISMRDGSAVSTDFRLAPEAVSLSEIVAAAKATPQSSAALPYRVEKVRAAVLPQENPTGDTGSGVVVPSNDSTWGSWRSVGRTESEAAVGFRLLTVPDLSVARIDLGSVSDVPVVRLVQRFPDGGALELIEAGSPVRFDGAEPVAGRARATLRRGSVFIAATAPLTTDELQALLDRLR